MWVLTVDGFLSAVEERRAGKHHGQIVVRSRERSALESLGEIAPTLSPIVIENGRDYRYRAWLDREAWSKACAKLALEVDYPNFKDAVRHKQGASRYEKALHEVWTVLSRLQPGGPYGWGGKGYPLIPKGEAGKRKRTSERLW